MIPEDILAFMRSSPFWVEASVGNDGAPQAAVVGVAVDDDFQLVFDTMSSSRKYRNLVRDPRVAFVMWSGAVTVQYEGVADIPTGEELARLKALYFVHFPDGPTRELLPETVYVRVRPTWIRRSDFAAAEPVITVFDVSALTR